MKIGISRPIDLVIGVIGKKVGGALSPGCLPHFGHFDGLLVWEGETNSNQMKIVCRPVIIERGIVKKKVKKIDN